MKSKLNTTIILTAILILSIPSFSQTQEKIPWPSLADSPWPIICGDAQGTGRSEFVGPSTGNVLWRKNMPLGIMYGPVIGYEDNLYMGTRAFANNDENRFYALDKNGYELWTFPTGSSYSNKAPAVLGKDSTTYIQSGSDYIHALNKKGIERWKTGPFLLNGLGFSISKTGDLYVSTGNDSLIVIDGKTGEVLIKKYMKPDFRSSLMVFSPDGEYFYFLNSENGQIEDQSLCKSDLTGNIIWEYEFLNCPISYPVIDNSGNIYCFGKESIPNNNLPYSNFLYSFDPDGSLRWKYQVRSFRNFSAPTIDHEGNIIFQSIENINDDPFEPAISVITSLDYFGNLNWEFISYPDSDISEVEIDHPLACDAEGKIYFGSTYGHYFYCLSKDGELLWKIDLEGNEFDSVPAISSDGTLYLGTHQGSLWQSHTRNLIAIKDKPNSVKDEKLSTEFNLQQNYPNPFNPSTTIKFSIPKVSEVKLSVYNTLGQEVVQLLNEAKHPGSYEVEFNGSSLSSGVYIYTLQTSTKRISRKMLLIK